MMNSSVKFVVNDNSSEKTIEKSSLTIEVANLEKLNHPNKIESPRIKLFSVDAVWWASMVQRNPCSYTASWMLSVNVEEKPGSSSESISFLTGGIIRSYAGSYGISCLTERSGKFNNQVCNDLLPLIHASSSSGEPIIFDFSLSVQHKSKLIGKTKFHDPVAVKKEILSNVALMLKDPKFSDFTFIVKEKEFKVHKTILASASDVLLNLFTSGLEESKKNVCKINDLDPSKFGEMIDFIYSGKLPENFNADSAQDLYKVAHIYNIKSLMKICEEEIHDGLTTENARKLYELSRLYDLEDLKKDSWTIIKREVLKICHPLKGEPLAPEDIDRILEHQQMSEEFWTPFKTLETSSANKSD